MLKILRPKAYVKASDKEQVKKEIENHSNLDHKNFIHMMGHNFEGVMHVKGTRD